MPDPAPPAPEELPEGAKHVRYEWEMLHHAAERLLAGTFSIIGDRNMAVEALFIHARGLREFFAGTPKLDDVHATHYSSTWTEEHGGLALERLEALSVEVNKWVAHITATRYREQREPRLITAILNDVREVLAAFAHEVDEQYRSFIGPEAVRTWNGVVDNLVGRAPATLDATTSADGLMRSVGVDTRVPDEREPGT